MSDTSEKEQFKKGQVWLSPRGYYYQVTETKGSQATLRMGVGGYGRKTFRDINATKNWSFVPGPITIY